MGIIREGRLIKVDRVDSLHDIAHHQIEIRFAGPVPVAEFEALPGVTDVTLDDHTLRMRVSGAVAPVVQAAAKYRPDDFISREPTLEEIFLAEYGTQREEAQ